MLRTILIYGSAAGVLVGGFLSATTILSQGHTGHGATAMAVGYLAMLVALSAVFLAIKAQRDGQGGGVIRFWPALGLGLGVSLIAGVFYVAAWELTLALTGMDFAGDYARAMVEQARAKGASGAALAKAVTEADAFRASYANPAIRWPMTFAEIFPVGVLVSLISAAVLRNPRVLPARRGAALVV